MLSNLSWWIAHEFVKITDQCEKISEISLKDKVLLFYDQNYAHSMNKRSLECVIAVVIYSYYHIKLSVTTGYFGPRCHFSLRYTGFCKSPEEVGVQLNLAWKSRAFVLFYRTAFFLICFLVLMIGSKSCVMVSSNQLWFTRKSFPRARRRLYPMKSLCIMIGSFNFQRLLWFADYRTQGERNGAKQLFFRLDILHSS